MNHSKQGRTNQSVEENPTAHMPKKKRPPVPPFPPDQKKASEAARSPSGKLAPIQRDNASAGQNVSQQAPSAQSVYMPTPLSLSKRPSRPNRVEDLLNPTAEDTTSAGGRQRDGNGMDSRWTKPIAATSRPATQPAAAVGKRPLGDVSLPSMTPALRDQASASKGSGSLLPSEISKAPNTLRAAHPSPAPRSSSHVQSQSVQSGHPASRNSSASSALPQLASTSEPQSHVSAPFTTMGPPPTLPQAASDKRAFDVTRPEVSHQSQYSTSDPEQIHTPASLDLQAASKVAEVKRKSVLYSRQWRQKREEKRQEDSDKVLELEAQLREITEEKERYQRERDLWQGEVLKRGIPIPPRTPIAKAEKTCFA